METEKKSIKEDGKIQEASDNTWTGTGMPEEIRISVRRLVEFILRHGDIDNRYHVSSDTAMQEGGRIHRMIQRRMGAEYEAEISLKLTYPTDNYILVVEGRADGIIHQEGCVTVDEIKGTYRDIARMSGPLPLHVAQAKCYAYMYGVQHGLNQVRVRMTYCHMPSGEIRYFSEECAFGELTEWFEGLVTAYRKWADYSWQWRYVRQESIAGLAFPYPYREGQRELVAHVYRTIYHKKKLFLEAPTGVGKTISTVYPTIQAIGRGMGEKFFYLTAKTITRTVAEDAIDILRRKGLRLKSITLTAKEKACFMEETECNPEYCPYAKGHYDRINDAVFDLITSQEAFDRDTIAAYAGKHMVCPFEMCLDVSLFADAVICDYNYLFDPHVYLKRFFGENSAGNYIFLIDEAHNLLERGREMYSAVLWKEEFMELRREIKKTLSSQKNKKKRKADISGQISLDGELFMTEVSHKNDTSDGISGSMDTNSVVCPEDVECVCGPEKSGKCLCEERESRKGFCKAREGSEYLCEAQESRKESVREEELPEDACCEVGEEPLPCEDAVEDMQNQEEAALDSGLGGMSALARQGYGEKLIYHLDKCNRELLAMKRMCEDYRIVESIESFVEGLTRLYAVLEDYLSEQEEGKSPIRDMLLDFYFEISHFLMVYELLDENYVKYTVLQEDGSFFLRLFCVNPRENLKNCALKGRSTILFSATLLPIQYYKKLLGGDPEDYEVYARSVFHPEKHALLVANDVTSKYTRRSEDEYGNIARYIEEIVKNRHGNYMVFCPSYAFLRIIHGKYVDNYGAEGRECILQAEYMSEADREAFLACFRQNQNREEERILIGFCVLGGIFSEGIDLKHDSLIGAIIVGTGLPQVCQENEILKAYFESSGENGFDYAYRYPGMNKVLQAAGRVIRTVDDVGIIALLDERFLHPAYLRLFPREWGQFLTVSVNTVAKRVERFWDQWL